MATTSYGNNYTDLQAGINTALALDIQRANAQDAANTARAVARIQQRGEESKSQAQQRDSESSRKALMERERYRGETDKELEKMRLDRSANAFDPKAFSTIAEIDALNNEAKQEFDFNTQLSTARVSIASEMKKLKDNMDFFDTGEPNKGLLRRVDPRFTELKMQLDKLDSAAAAKGLTVDPVTGGYLFKPFKAVQIPAMLNRGAGIPQVAPATVAPAQSWGVDPSTIPSGNPNSVAPPAMFSPAAPSMGSTSDLYDPSMGMSGLSELFNLFRRAPAPAPVAPYGPPTARETFGVQNGNVFRIPAQ